MRMIYDKYAAVDDFLKPDVQSLLDVGCRDAILRQHIRPQIKYTGVDIAPGPNVDKIANLEDGLPFADREFDAVVALDLLEHTNNIWFAFDELVRVARRQVFIVLPNVYHWSSRVRLATAVARATPWATWASPTKTWASQARRLSTTISGLLSPQIARINCSGLEPRITAQAESPAALETLPSHVPESRAQARSRLSWSQ